MTYHELRPHPALQDSLACYFFLQREDGEPASEELVIPDGTHGLMFVQEARFTRQSNAGVAGRQVAGSYLFGQKTQPVRYVFDTPGLHCFGVKFQPHGLRAFTPLPAAELTDTLAEAAPLLGKNFGELEDRLFSAKSLQEKKDLLDAFFLKKRLPEAASEQRLVQQILQHIHQRHGQAEVANLLQNFGLQYKRLERLFQKHVGVSPKTYCRLTRFNATLLHHSRKQGNNLTQLAYSSGYFDQMHFIREVKHFTHLTPKEFYKNTPGNIASHQRQLLSERLA